MSTILTVSAVNTYVSFKLKNDPKLKGIAISGEITDLNINRNSGHMYFSLTDGTATIKAVMFASNTQRLKFSPQNGLSVVAFGSIDVYEKSGVYQLLATQLLPSGKGIEYLSLIELKSKLEAEGIFQKPKKPIAKYPNKIAVVSSQSGAAVHDIYSVIQRRYPIVEICLFAATVQGENAPKSIANALILADSSGADTIILSRGGGSDSDLACFNSETVIMAVYNCKTPIISAVGHEIDYSLCDIVADMRAPTPSAAAEIATPNLDEIVNKINAYNSLAKEALLSKLTSYELNLKALSARIEANSPKNSVLKAETQLILLSKMLHSSFNGYINAKEQRLKWLLSLLETCNYNSVLNRGYAIVSKNNGVVTSANSLSVGDCVEIKFKDTNASAVIKSIGENI